MNIFWFVPALLWSNGVAFEVPMIMVVYPEELVACVGEFSPHDVVRFECLTAKGELVKFTESGVVRL